MIGVRKRPFAGMMERKFLRGRKFKPRPSREDLIEDTSIRFRELGGDNFVQAKILHDLSQHISKSRVGPKVSRFLAVPRQRNGKAWLFAYAIVLEFLAEYQMGVTASSISIENRGKLPKKDDSLLKGKTAAQFLTGLLRSRRRNPGFSERVGEFARAYGLEVKKAVIEDDFESEPEEVGTTLAFGDESD